ncbi:hypothetical protein VTP01DRAFT_8401 [Rhizomucor pusillus]|uniref:uncharacterized protein n=1 Tax=Rhizomucor pusillus TaxID=4840 RepID=UPI0037421AF2
MQQYHLDLQQIDDEFEMNKRNLKNVFKQYANRVQREDEGTGVEKQLVKHRGQEIPLAKILRQKLGTFGDSSKRRNISDRSSTLGSRLPSITASITDDEAARDIAEIEKNISAEQEERSSIEEQQSECA